MALWDNVVSGFKSGLMGKGPNYVRRQQEHQLDAYTDIALRSLRLNASFRRAVRENATGRSGMVEYGSYNGQPAQVEFTIEGGRPRIDIFFGDLRELKKNKRLRDRSRYGHVVWKYDHIAYMRDRGEVGVYDERQDWPWETR